MPIRIAPYSRRERAGREITVEERRREMRVIVSILRGILQTSKFQVRVSIFASHTLAAPSGSLTLNDCLEAGLLLAVLEKFQVWKGAII